MPIIRSPSNCRCSLWFPLTNRPRLRTRPPPHSYGNQRLQGQFDGLLMMGIIMPETCSAVPVRQNNKILRLIVASSWVFFFFTVFRVLSPDVLSTCPNLPNLPFLISEIISVSFHRSTKFTLVRTDSTPVYFTGQNGRATAFSWPSIFTYARHVITTHRE